MSLALRPLLTWADLATVDAARLRKTLERLLGSVVAADTVATRADDRLNQLCNLVLLKLESDRHGRARPLEPLRFQPGESEGATAVAMRSAFAHLRRAHPEVFTPTADRGLLLAAPTIDRVVRELSGVRLLDAPGEAVSQAFQVFRAASLKSEEGQYFTPQRVIMSAVAFLDVHPSDVVLDPACGTGGFLLEASRSLGERYPEVDLRTWLAANVVGVDRDAINVKLTRAMLAMLGNGSANVFAGDALRAHRWLQDSPHLLDALADRSFTCIVTNPPFGESLKVSADDARRSGFSIGGAEVGLMFLERCHRLLRRGGRLGIVLPETYFFSASYDWLPGWLDGRLVLRGMLNIPMEAFQGFCRAKTNFYVFERV